MRDSLPILLKLIGAGQLLVLIASLLVPSQLNWSETLRSLPKLQRQMYWVYGGYVVLGIISLGLLTILCSEELASGSRLARGVCAYGAIFWGIRLSLQLVFDVKPHLTLWWLRVGYHLLTVLFTVFTLVYAAAIFAV